MPFPLIRSVIPLFFALLLGCKSEVKDLPNLDIDTLNIQHQGEIPFGQKIEMTLQLKRLETEKILSGRIGRRGGYSFIYPKHSYEIDLEEDVSIAQLPMDDDWILNANYIDKTFLRHVVSYELFREMHPNNKAAKTQFVEVELNGIYNGLYVLMEKLDKSSLGIQQDKQAMVFKEPPIFRKDYDHFRPQKPKNFYQQTYPRLDPRLDPRLEDGDQTLSLDAVREFLVSSNDSLFSKNINQLFDIQNIIDWNILLLLTNNGDGILKNFYLYKMDEKTPLRIAPWDYDHSFGRDGDNELNMVEPLNINKSILFDRLMKVEWYRTKLKDRWTELNESNIISPAALKTKINLKKILIKALVDKNTKVWPVKRSIFWPIKKHWYYDNNDFDEEIEIMYSFIDIRHQQLLNYFKQ